MFKHNKNEVENQLGKWKNIIRSDQDGEYVASFEKCCLEFGIIHQITAPYSPQSNGVIEGKIILLKK